jgi:hypothetical protein
MTLRYDEHHLDSTVQDPESGLWTWTCKCSESGTAGIASDALDAFKKHATLIGADFVLDGQPMTIDEYYDRIEANERRIWGSD